MINSQDRISSPENVADSIINSIYSGLRVALPCIVQSFDASKQTCTAQPTLKAKLTNYDGTVNLVDYPLLVDVPVQFPSAGGVTMTFPVKAGDECLVIFADRCIDFWWQNGGIQETIDPRKHHLADGIAILGIKSIPHVIPNISADSMQIRSDDGTSFIELNPTSKDINIKTPSNFSINANTIKMDASTITIDATTSIIIKTPVTTINGILQINGAIIQGGEGENNTATFNGSIQSTGDIKAGNISLEGHIHTGVHSGSDDTGAAK